MWDSMYIFQAVFIMKCLCNFWLCHQLITEGVVKPSSLWIVIFFKQRIV